MGRMELVQRIAAEHPHLVRRDVEAIVETVVREMAPKGETRDGLAGAANGRQTGASAEQLKRFIDVVSKASDEELDRSIDYLDPALVQATFEAAFDVLGQSADTLEQIVADNARFHEEFASRTKEIDALIARNDEHLRRLMAQ
jgi:hypothetical protein